MKLYKYMRALDSVICPNLENCCKFSSNQQKISDRLQNLSNLEKYFLFVLVIMYHLTLSITLSLALLLRLFSVNSLLLGIITLVFISL